MSCTKTNLHEWELSPPTSPFVTMAGTPDQQSLRWSVVLGAICVCSFCTPHAGIATDRRVQFWRRLTASVRVSRPTGFRLSQEMPTFGSLSSSLVGHVRSMHPPARCARDVAVALSVAPQPSQSPNPSLWCRRGHCSHNINPSMPRHGPPRFQLLLACNTVLPPARV